MVARNVLRLCGCRNRKANVLTPLEVTRSTRPTSRMSAISSLPVSGTPVLQAASVNIWRMVCPLPGYCVPGHWGHTGDAKYPAAMESNGT